MSTSDLDVENETSKNLPPVEARDESDDLKSKVVEDVYIASKAADFKVTLATKMATMKNSFERVRSLENENDKLNIIVNELKEKISEKMLDNTRLNGENQELRSHLEIVKRSNEQLQSNFKSLERHNLELKSDLDEKFEEIQNVKNERDKLYNNIDNFNKDKRKYDSASNEYEAQIERLNITTQTLRNEVNDQNELIDRLRKELQDERLKASGSDKIISEKIEDATTHLKSDIEEYRREINSLRTKLSEVSSVRSEQDKMLLDTKGELNMMLKLNESLKEQIAEIKQRIPVVKQYNDVQTGTVLSNVEIIDMCEELEDLRNVKEMLRKKEEELTVVQRDLVKSTKSASKFQENFTPLLEQRSDEINALKEQLKKLKKELNEIKEKNEEIVSINNSLENEAKKLRIENRKCLGIIEENKAYLREADENLSNLNEIRENLQKKIEENMNLFNSERELKSENRELHIKTTNLVEEVESLKYTIGKLKKEREEIEELIEKTVKEQDKKVIALTLDLETVSESNADLQRRLANSEGNGTQLAKILTNIKRELTNKTNEAENMEELLEERLKQLNNLSNVEKDNQNLKSELKESGRIRRQLQVDILSLKETIQSFENKIDLLQTKIKGLTNENEKISSIMKVKIEAAEQKVLNSEKLTNVSKFEFDSLKERFGELQKKCLDYEYQLKQNVSQFVFEQPHIEGIDVGIQADIDPTTQMAVNILSTKILELIDVSDFNSSNLLQSFERVVNQCQLLVNLANQRNEKIKILEEEIGELNSKNNNLAVINNELSCKLEGFTEGNFTDDHVGELAKYFDALKKSSIIIYNALELFNIRMNDLFVEDSENVSGNKIAFNFENITAVFEKLKKGELKEFENNVDGYLENIRFKMFELLKNIQKSKQAHNTDVSKYQTALRKLQEKRNELTNVIQNLNNRYENVIKENNENVSKLKEQHELLLEEKEKEIENIVENNENLCKEYLSEIENLREETEKLQDRLLKEKSSELSELLQQLEKERKESEDSLDEQRALFEMKNLEHEELIKSLKSKHDENIEELLKERDLKERELLERLSMALAEHDTVMKKFMIDHEESIVESKEKLEMELEKMNQSHNIEINDLKANHEIELTSLKTFYENELMEVKKHVEDIQNNSEIKLKTIVERHQQELTRVEVEYKTKVNQSEAEYRGKIDEITKLQTAHESSVNQLSSSFDTRVAEIYNSHSNERDRLVEDYEQQLRRSQISWKEEIKMLKQTQIEEISKLKSRIGELERNKETTSNEYNNMKAQSTYYQKLSDELLNENIKYQTNIKLYTRFVNTLLPTFKRLNAEFSSINIVTDGLKQATDNLRASHGSVNEIESLISLIRDERSDMSPTRSQYTSYNPLENYFFEIEQIAVILGITPSNDITRMLYEIRNEVERLLENDDLGEVDSDLISTIRQRLTETIKSEGLLKQRLMMVEQQNESLKTTILSLQNESALLKENVDLEDKLTDVKSTVEMLKIKEHGTNMELRMKELEEEVDSLQQELIKAETSKSANVTMSQKIEELEKEISHLQSLQKQRVDTSNYQTLCETSTELYEILLNVPFETEEVGLDSELEFTPGSPSKQPINLFVMDEEQKKLDVFWHYAYLINEHYSSLLFNESIDKTVNLLDHKSELDIVDLSSKSLRIILETFKQQSEFSSFTNFITKDDSKLTKLFIGPFVTIIWLCKQMIFYREVSKRHEVTIMEDLTRTQLIKNDNNNMKEKMHDMEAELLILRDQIIDLESSNERNEKEFKKLTLHCVDLENDNKKKDKKLKDMTIDVQNMNRIYGELEEERKERLKLVRINHELKNQLKKERNDVEKVQEAVSFDKNDSLKVAEPNVKDKPEIDSSLNGEIHEDSSEVIEATFIQSPLRKESPIIEKNHGDLIQTLNDEIILLKKKNEQKLREYSIQIENYTEQIAENTNRISKLTENIESKRKALNVALRKLDILSEEKKEVEESLKLRIQLTEDLQDQIKEYQTLNIQNQTEIAKLKQDQQTIKNVQFINDENKLLLTNLNKTKKELVELENQNENLRKSIEIRDKQLYESKILIEELQRDINDLREDAETKVGDDILRKMQYLERLEKDKENLKLKSTDSSKQNEGKFLNVLNQLNKAHDTIETKIETINKLKFELSEQLNEINKLQVIISVQKKEMEKIQSENPQDNQENLKLTTDLFSLRKRHRQLVEQYRRTLQEVSNLPSTYPQVQKAKSQLRKLNQQMVDLSRV
eukprot:TRINITY_DN3195_c0_g1_i1.p1 TRINITY_DN3195_c0_g1~~TRINITY_DN3195_c0_g1_i1.p1  ORF type:complete len:2234 (-),score=814.92 TRINITY_DN3195_c0_g1_i1:24-6725(-)